MGDNEEKGKPEEGGGEKSGKEEMQIKIVRMVTVMIYLGAVMGGGTLLSLYYIIFWDPNIKIPKPEISSSRWKRDLNQHIIEHSVPEISKLILPAALQPVGSSPNLPAAPKLDAVESSTVSVQRLGTEETPQDQLHNTDVTEKAVEEKGLKMEQDNWVGGLPPNVFKYPRKLPQATIDAFMKRIDAV